MGAVQYIGIHWQQLKKEYMQQATRLIPMG